MSPKVFVLLRRKVPMSQNMHVYKAAPLTLLNTWGAFHSTQNSGNFGWYIKWKGPFRFSPTVIFGTSFECGPLCPVRLSLSVGPKCPFPFDKIVVPSTAHLYPAYKNNNQTPRSLGRVWATGMCFFTGHVEFLKFQTGIFAELKAP